MISRGFKEIPVDHPTAVAYAGPLRAGQDDIPIRIAIRDWEFIDLPEITVLEPTQDFRPHLFRSGWLCYLRPGDVILNRHSPANAVAYCLDKAATVLADQRRPDYSRTESREEFRIYWNRSRRYVLHATIERKAELLARSIADQMFYVGTDLAEVNALRKAGSLQVADSAVHDACCNVIQMRQHPWLDNRGVPNTHGAMIDWLRGVDMQAYGEYISLLRSRRWKGAKSVLVLFSSPIGFFGFYMPLSEESRFALKKPHTDLKLHFTQGLGARLPIEPLIAHDCSPRFLHERNLARSSTLGGLRIHLVGAGAIGGYLAQALVRFGAGTEGGKLAICDSESLFPENLGRHTLGFDMLFKNKAEGLKEKLLQEFPYADVEPICQDVRTWRDLFNADLVIDATGEQALSSALSERHQILLASKSPCPPLTHAWICGNGEAVQVLWTASDRDACHDCLWHFLPGGGLQERFPLGLTAHSKQIGCRSFTPYAVTAPLAAASLCAQQISEWRAGDVRPRFRTLRLDGRTHRQSAKNENPDPLQGCPSCQPHKLS